MGGVCGGGTMDAVVIDGTVLGILGALLVFEWTSLTVTAE